MSLAVHQFADFFAEVNGGHSPFPWQQRLLEKVAQERRWPDVLNLPTGTGKTSVLEIGLFHLALEAGRPDRQAPLRMAFVVDRRLIVDQAEQRAIAIAKLLHEPVGPVTRLVTERLLRFQHADSPQGVKPLHVAKLRGGMPQEKIWARTPSQPTILLSTVDQTGSRLLFRGYGVSSRMAPVHAGLLGEDCLIFLDEAHLSEAFRQTVRSIRAIERGERGLNTQLVTLSATPAGSDTERFELDDQDRQHPVLNKRLTASKPAELLDGRDFAEEALKHAGQGAVLVVVNRVKLARQVFETVRAKVKEQAVLLTGRVRELEREQLRQRIESHVKSGRTSNEPIIVVATQTIEAGADYDFDTLVTQVAPFDSLVQRFGRLNRLGDRPHATGKILASKDDINPRKPDPVYGDRMAECWKFLKEAGPLDFGIGKLPEPANKPAVSTEKKNAPVLMAPYLDFWTQTSPRPSADPHVPLFLHGEQNASADVNLVWRDDLGFWEQETERNSERIARLLELMPPRPGEAMPVPVYAAKAWLERRSAQVADIESVNLEERGEAKRLRGPVFRCNGEKPGLVWPEDIRPGDTLVIPSRYGGCDEFGWHPESEKPVPDLADEAAQPYAGRNYFVRLHPSRFRDEHGALDEETWRKAEKILYDRRDDVPTLIAELKGKAWLPSAIREQLDRLPERGVDLHEYYEGEEGGRGIVLFAPKGAKATAPPEETDLGETDREASVRLRQRSLHDHTEDVKRWLQKFAESLPLDAQRATDLMLAAELHDLGKGDRRFQAYLHGTTAFTGEPIAKSGQRQANEQRLRKQAQLPDYWRHEALSVRLALSDPRLQSAQDSDLVLWLIGTHHGYGRPFFPHEDPLDAVDRRVLASDGSATLLSANCGPQDLGFDYQGLDWASLFRTLEQRYGRWRLAHFEAILRLADARASEEADRA